MKNGIDKRSTDHASVSAQQEDDMHIDDFLVAELEQRFPPCGATINQLLESFTRNRVYQSLEKMRSSGLVKREPQGNEFIYLVISKSEPIKRRV